MSLRTVHLLPAIGLGLVVLAGFGIYADAGDLAAALAAFDWPVFPAALALVVGNYAVRAWRWHVYLRLAGAPVPARRSAFVFAAGLAGTISPGKLGEGLKGELLHVSHAVPYRRSLAAVFAERVTDLAGLAALAAVAGSGRAGGTWLAVAAGGLVALLVLALRLPALDRFPPLAEARATAGALLRLPLLAGMSAVAAASWFLECLAAWLVLRGAGIELSLAEAVTAFSVASLAGALSFLPGGLGVAEGSMAGILRAFGAAPAAAAAGTLLVRLATLWFAVAIGLAALALEGVRRGASPAPAPSDPTEHGA